MISKTEDVIKKSKIPYFSISEQEQTGACFGQKLANAVEGIFQKGYERIIVLGNDCPTLTTDLIQKAASKLKSQDWVLGPDLNGGLYLIGINKAHFKKEAFTNLAWESSCLQDDFKTSLNVKPTFWLNPRSDLNTNRQVQNFFFNSPFRHSLVAFVRSISSSENISFSFLNTIQLSQFPLDNPSLRGPPFAL